MKPLLKIGLVVVCVSAAGLSRLPAFAQSQPSGNQTEHQIAETSDRDGETNDDAKGSRAEQTQLALIHMRSGTSKLLLESCSIG